MIEQPEVNSMTECELTCGRVQRTVCSHPSSIQHVRTQCPAELQLSAKTAIKWKSEQCETASPGGSRNGACNLLYYTLHFTVPKTR